MRCLLSFSNESLSHSYARQGLWMGLFWEFRPCALPPPHTLGPQFRMALFSILTRDMTLLPILRNVHTNPSTSYASWSTRLDICSNMCLVLYNGVKFTQMGDNIHNIRGWTQLPPCPQPLILWMSHARPLPRTS